ncbi:MAG TPA: methyltransferase, partial [Burkholderiales bacterium]|nr:methyltransferase [Burkholderiales bacterium]
MHTAAALSHVAPAREALYNFMYEPGDGSPQHNCDYRIHEVRIDDARAVSPAPSLHAEGFELRQAPSAVRDFRDDEEVRKT